MHNTTDCSLVDLQEKIADLQQKLDAMAAENAALKNGIGFFSYSTDNGFEEHDSAEKAIASAEADIDYYRVYACDDWSEETDQTVWGVILQRATVVDELPRTEDDSYLGRNISSLCDYALLPNLATPATDAILNATRADGIEMLAENLATPNPELADGTNRINKAVAWYARQFASKLRTAGQADKDGE